jgi:hypothetical protein
VPGDGLQRPRYFDGQQLDAADFDVERQYLDTLRRLHNTRLHSWGIAAGLVVTAGADQRSVRISAGMAIDPKGREVGALGEVALPVSGAPGAVLDLFASVRPDPAEPTQASGVAGYARIAQNTTFRFVGYGQSVDPDAVFLATVMLDDQAKVSDLDTAARRHCGFDVGSLVMREPAAGGAVATLSAGVDEDGATLTIQAAAVEFMGALQLAGSLTVREGDRSDHPRAMLDVLSTRDPLVSVVGVGGAPLLNAGHDGSVRVGAVTSTQTLAAAGDVTLDDGHKVEILGPGQLASVAPGADSASQAVRLAHIPTQTGDDGAAPIPCLDFVETHANGRIDMASGVAAKGPPAPVLSVFANGQVVVDAPAGFVPASPPGPNDPAPPLMVVNGWVQSLVGGYQLGDVNVQASSAGWTTVRVGCVIDWWPGPPDSSKPAPQPPPQYRLCNGQVIDVGPMKGATLPNLNGVYVRGVTDYGSIGVSGGLQGHQHTITSIPVHTHDITHTHVKSRNLVNRDAGPGDNTTFRDKSSNIDHDHYVDITLQQSNETQSGPNSGDVKSTLTSIVPNTPRSMALLKIMRVI